MAKQSSKNAIGTGLSSKTLEALTRRPGEETDRGRGGAAGLRGTSWLCVRSSKNDIAKTEILPNRLLRGQVTFDLRRTENMFAWRVPKAILK
jgi:hypothetical protein